MSVSLESSAEWRLNDLQKQCVRFSAYFANTRVMKRSSVTEDIKNLYGSRDLKLRKVNRPSNIGRNFVYLDVCDVLQTLQKFSGAKTASSSNSNEAQMYSSIREVDVESSEHDYGKDERPASCKGAKKMKVKTDHEKKKPLLASPALDFQKKKNGWRSSVITSSFYVLLLDLKCFSQSWKRGFIRCDRRRSPKVSTLSRVSKPWMNRRMRSHWMKGLLSSSWR